MLFNSYEFIFAFLPIVLIVYFIMTKLRWITGSKIWLILASLFFYSWWNIVYLPLIVSSIFINFAIGRWLLRTTHKKKLLITGIIFNVSFLGYFKYADFFIENMNLVLPTNLPLLELALPLAISFFTFQQIAFLIDAYRQETREYSFIDYALFITFFPQLIAGPIVLHHEMMPQFNQLKKKYLRLKNIALGTFIFFIGLFKKVVIADTFATFATPGFANSANLTLIEGWITSLSYTLQLYFDFSGYSDMAIGVALLFNIKLPINFNSPYKAVNIQDFWRRWHITLSRFLTHYLYIPLGGNRVREVRTLTNIMIIFLVSGFWHGAGWTFIFWGFLHGAASVMNRLWRKLNFKMYTWLAWLITFNFVNMAWVFFRAESLEEALNVLKAMVGLNGIKIPPYLSGIFERLNITSVEVVERFYVGDLFDFHRVLIYLVVFLLISVFARNSIELLNSFKPNLKTAIFAAFLAVVAILYLNQVSEFLYFNF